MGAPVYIGVDLNVTGEVASVSLFEDAVAPHLTVVQGRFDDEKLGVIHVIDDGSKAAAAVLRTEAPVGLGWSFR